MKLSELLRVDTRDLSAPRTVSMLVQCPKNKKKRWLFLVDAMPKLWVEALNKDFCQSCNLRS